MPYGSTVPGDEESLLAAEAPVTPTVAPKNKQQRAMALTVLCVSAGVLGTLAYQASIDERSSPAAAQMDAELGVGAMGSVKKHGETTQSSRYTVSGKSTLSSSDETTLTPVDSKATDETVALMSALSSLRYDTKFLFGHQNTNYIGQYFLDKDGTAGYSDVKNGTGSYPAVFGYDFADVVENGISFTEHVKTAYENGGIVAFDWKPCNPEKVNSACANEVYGTPCSKILGESAKPYTYFTGWLDTIIDEIKTFKVNGIKIPIIFRLFHENTGGWYWWGVDSYDDVQTCTDDEYKALFNFTQDYIHDAGVHNILWEYAPAKPSDDYDSAFYDRYPGSDRIDIVAFDRYSTDSDYKDDVLSDCQTVAEWAEDHNLLAAIGETGISSGIQDETTSYKDWYYDDFGKNFMTDSTNYCSQIVYALAWENANEHSYWVPLPNDALWDGFNELYESDYAVFADDSDWQTTLTDAGYYA